MPWNEVMPKFKAGMLKSGGSGKAVKSPKQAVAIMLSEKKAANGGKSEYQAALNPKSAAKIRSKAGMMMVLLLALAVPAWAGPTTFQVTIGATATQISTTHLYCSAWIIQNNAAHNIRFGDSGTTSSKGTVLASGSPGGSYTTTASMNGSQPAPDDLSQWYVAGTQNDVVDVTCKQVNF